MKGLDYPWTCPSINKYIELAREEITSHITIIVEELKPRAKDKDQLIERLSQELYDDLEDIFEFTRRTNEKIREEAGKQIRELKEEILKMKEEL